MKRIFITLSFLAIVISIAASGGSYAYGQESANSQASGMPIRPIPAHPIPHHEVGHPSRAGGYSTTVTRLNALGEEETVQLTGLDARLADGHMDDPLQGNPKLVSLDKIMYSDLYLDELSFGTYELDKEQQLQAVPESDQQLGNNRLYDIAAGDLNGDLVDEQIAAWIEDNGQNGQIKMFTGEMPGSFGRATSAPAVLYDNDVRFSFVRGYDDAIWHHNGTGWSSLGGRLLSGPAVASRAAGQYDVFAVGLDPDPSPTDGNYLTVWHNFFDGNWSGWQPLDSSFGEEWPEIKRQVTTPELPAPAVAANSGKLDLFWLWPDNTLRWRHNNGSSWGDWQNLGGMLASGPGAVFHDGQLDVFARGVDDALWMKTKNGDAWGTWQRIDQPGMPAGVTIASAPAVVSPAAHELLVAVRSSDGQLWQLAYRGGSWGEWNSASLDKSSPGKVGGAVTLDGVDDYIDLTDNFPKVKDFTFAAWVYWEGGDAWQRIFDFGQNSNKYMFLTPKSDSTAHGEGEKLIFGITEGGGLNEEKLVAGQALTTGGWNHVAVTLKDNQGKLYLNGELKKEGNIILDPEHVIGSNTWLGKSQYKPDPTFNGKIDEVLILNRALSGTEIAAIVDSGWDEADPALMWLPLDESPASHGLSLADASGSGNEGTLYTFEGSKFTSAPALVTKDGAVDLVAMSVDGHIQQGTRSASYWTDWTSISGLPHGNTYELPGAMTDEPANSSAYHNSLMDIDTGYFTGDGREQIVLTYRSAAGVEVELYDVVNGFEPKMIAKLSEPIDVESIRSSPRCTGGDVDGDGMDEIGCVYIPDEPLKYYELDIYEFDYIGEDPEENLRSLIAPQRKYSDNYFHVGSLHIAAGDIIPDEEIANDEFVVVSSWHNQHTGYAYQFQSFITLYDHEDRTFVRKEKKFIEAIDKAVGNYDQIGVALAVGDVDAQPDGLDEIVVTWPGGFYSNDYPDLWRDLVVYSGKEGEGDLKVEKSWSLGHSQITYLDTLAAADLDQDLADEIVLFGNSELSYYEYMQDGPTNRLTYPTPDAISLAAGDFTGDSQRVGPPSYRRQHDVGQVIAIINAPPKHQDKVNGQLYTLNVGDPDTYSQFEQVTGSSTEVSVTTQKDWGVSSEFKMTIGDPDATHTTTSLENSYGENFSKTDDWQQSTTYSQRITASEDDALMYTRMDYDVWEYPVYDSLTLEPQGTLSVVWPSGMEGDKVADGSECDTWYRPNHQLGNMWSYPNGDEQLADRDPERDDLTDFPLLTVGMDPRDFSLNFSDAKDGTTSHGYELGIASSFEAQIGGEEVGVELGAVSFSTRLPSLCFSTSAEYNHSELSTWTTETTESTTLSCFFAPFAEKGSERRYKVEPYLYWSENDYLVFNYLTEPTTQAFWSASGDIYNKPDPAFNRLWPDTDVNDCRGEIENAQFFSSDITISPPIAKVGQEVEITATIRNFSEVGNGDAPFNQPFKVSFYQGDPDDGGKLIKHVDIGVGALKPRSHQPTLERSINWVAEGSGEQHIYVVIDRADELDEVHDQKDPDAYNNNKAFGILSLDQIEFIDAGLSAVKAYYEITLPLKPNVDTNDAAAASGDSSPDYAIHVPLAATDENMRVDLRVAEDLTGWKVLGLPLAVDAYQTNWESPEPDFSFTPADGDAPAVITVDYANVNLAGWNEDALRLYRYTGSGWELANHTCEMDGQNPIYEMEHFKDQDILAVPICQTGRFAVSDKIPTEKPTHDEHVYMPVVMSK